MPLCRGGGSSGRLAAGTTSSRHSTAIGALLPPLGAHGGGWRLRLRLRRFIVSPYDPRYLAWENSLVALVAYCAWVAPFEFGFLPDPRGALAIADNAVNAAFAVDIALTFFVAYAEGRTYLSLKFRTDSEGLQQQETLGALPKAIRSAISHHLFFRSSPSSRASTSSRASPTTSSSSW